MAEFSASEQAEARELTGGWWLFALAGVISIVVGILIMLKPSDSLTTLAVIAGIFILLDGIIELVASILHGTHNRGTVALLGVVTAIIGVLLIRHPVGGVTAIALLIAIWLIAIGLLRCLAAFEAREHRGWNLFAGGIELIAGIVIVANPNIGFATLALIVGIAFILNGVGMLSIGWSMKAIRTAVAAG